MVYFFARANKCLQEEIYAASPRRHLVATGCAGRRGARGPSDPHATDLGVTAFLAEVRILREENAALRNAALTFGALAERLNERAKSTTCGDRQ